MSVPPGWHERRPELARVILGCISLAAVCFVSHCAAAAELPEFPQSVHQIVFAVRQPGKDPHYYANFGYFAFDTRRKAYGEGGRLCRLNLQTGQTTVLVDDPQGAVRDPQVHYTGRKILFAYRKGQTPNYHLYEIQADGSGLRQLTDGPWDDIEPAYLPDGGIIFCSSGCVTVYAATGVGGHPNQ